MKCAALATIDFPEPVGVAKMTLSPASSASEASSCAGYSEMPREVVHELNESHTASSNSDSGACAMSSSKSVSITAFTVADRPTR